MTGLGAIMADRDFFETNIPIYAADRSEPEKQSQARRLLKTAIENETNRFIRRRCRLAACRIPVYLLSLEVRAHRA